MNSMKSDVVRNMASLGPLCRDNQRSPLELEQPLNACNNFIVTHALFIVQLRQPFLHFSSEPFVVIEIGFRNFVDKLVGGSTAL